MQKIRLAVIALACVLSPVALAENEAEQAATEIEVNESQWEKLSEEERAQVEDALGQSFPGQNFTFVPSPGAAIAAVPSGKPQQCESICKMSGMVGSIACAWLISVNPMAAALCTAAVPTAEQACIGQCDKKKKKRG